MAKPPALFCDVDGVLAFQPEGDILAVNARFGSSWLVADATRYPFRSMLPREQAAWLRENAPVIAANLAPDTRAIRVLRKAAEAGIPVSIVTERPPAMEALTRAWCSYWAIPGADMARALGPGGKEDVLAGYGPDDPALLLDDSPANACLARPGVEVWQPARPYNDGSGGAHRFEDWREVCKRLGLKK